MAGSTLTPRRTQTREKLMDAATTLFAQKGVLAASVEEICERAEFTRGAFYSNFADKDELCLAVLNRQAAREL
ncbi:MAG TPA: helix-turn-helix domain-containing protein, partial [Propionicimonas sp.]|nr:helix-turn-helix domain-containing protein [Propionicimonas sp.]